MFARKIVSVLLLLSAVFMLLCNGYSEIEASSNTCFSATDTTTSSSYLFNAPENGVIKGIKLSYNSGSGINCNVNRYPYSPWGCTASKIMVMLIRVTDTSLATGEIIYPTLDTNDVDSSTYGNTLCYDSFGTACPNKYVMGSSNSYTDPLLLVSDSTTFSVTTSDIFSLQICESICAYTLQDNGGTTCATVTFLYESIGMFLNFFFVFAIGEN